jgi:ABC-type protease/lipase transport system fused ATPase/permease subunit
VVRSNIVIIHDPTAFGRSDKQAKALERERRLQEELATRALEAVQAFERQHEIDERWTENSPLWVSAQKLVTERTYRRALDNLEGLVVARMFELTKMNMSGTGKYLLANLHLTLIVVQATNNASTLPRPYRLAHSQYETPSIDSMPPPLSSRNRSFTGKK